MRTAAHAPTLSPAQFQACAMALPLLMLGLAPSALPSQVLLRIRGRRIS